MNTALYLLRALQIGLSIEALEHLSVGMVVDMIIEHSNDSYEYPYKATQADIDRL